jgi:hypothetical protein
MGVNIFILDRRPVKLAVGGVEQDVGSLRRFWKITELDEERAGELSASEAVVAGRPSPKAAMVADVVEMPLGSTSGVEVRAHPVIGWDKGRTRVTDMGWDFLPVLGYAVRDLENDAFVLHEMRDGALYRMNHERALELGLLGADGHLVEHEQPVITACENVRPFLDRYADADCTLSDGRKEKLMTVIEGGGLPPTDWFIGKKPMQVEKYPPTPGHARAADSRRSPGGRGT